MPRYLLLEPAYLNERMYAAGDVVETALAPGPHMEPHRDEKGIEDAEARAAKDLADEQSKLPAPGDPRFIGEMIMRAMTDPATNGRIETSSRPLMTNAQANQPIAPPKDPGPPPPPKDD